MAVVRFYSDEVVDWRALQRAAKLYPQLSVTTELCYNVELTGEHEAPEVSKEVDTPPADHDRLSCHIVSLSVSSPPPQAAAVSVQSRRTFSSGCFAHRCRKSHCLRRRSGQRAAGRSWWRSDPGSIGPRQSDNWRSLIYHVTCVVLNITK